MEAHKNPKLFEYDPDNKIVDIFVKKDPTWPYPYRENDWYHQGFYLNEFILLLNDFFRRYELPFIIKHEKEEIKE